MKRQVFKDGVRVNNLQAQVEISREQKQAIEAIGQKQPAQDGEQKQVAQVVEQFGERLDQFGKHIEKFGSYSKELEVQVDKFLQAAPAFSVIDEENERTERLISDLEQVMEESSKIRESMTKPKRTQKKETMVLEDEKSVPISSPAGNQQSKKLEAIQNQEDMKEETFQVPYQTKTNKEDKTWNVEILDLPDLDEDLSERRNSIILQIKEAIQEGPLIYSKKDALQKKVKRFNDKISEISQS
jgi:hypothetical protein